MKYVPGLLALVFLALPVRASDSKVHCLAYCAIPMPVPPAIPGQWFGLCKNDPEWEPANGFECADQVIPQLPENPYRGQMYYLGSFPNSDACQQACQKPCEGWNVGLPGRPARVSPEQVSGVLMNCEAKPE